MLKNTEGFNGITMNGCYGIATDAVKDLFDHSSDTVNLLELYHSCTILEWDYDRHVVQGDNFHKMTDIMLTDKCKERLNFIENDLTPEQTKTLLKYFGDDWYKILALKDISNYNERELEIKQKKTRKRKK